MEKFNCEPSSLSSISSDTENLNAPSAAVSHSNFSENPLFPSPANTFSEPKRNGGCTHTSQIQGTDERPEDGKLTFDSNSDEEMVKQHAYDIVAEYTWGDVTHEQHAWDACPIQHGDTFQQVSLGGDANQSCIDIYADVERGWAFASVKQGDGEEDGRAKCCRVCQLSFEKSPSGSEFMKLGCACKDDLALAHRLCAETWFKIKGNRTCEICGSTARNILGSGDTNSVGQCNDGETNNLGALRSERCWQNQPLCNTLLVCVILVLIASWVFRVTVF